MFSNWFSTPQSELRDDWKELTETEQLESIEKRSEEKPVVLFKHSTRCSISYMAKKKLEADWDKVADAVEIYYLDLIRYRHISNEIESRYGVRHESPQVILLHNGEVRHHASHAAIDTEDLVKIH